jgi:hypothetical protein
MHFHSVAKYNRSSSQKSNSGVYVLRKLNPSEPKVSASAAPSARNARTKTSDKAPGARPAKHSKAVVEEPIAAPATVAPIVAAPVVAVETPFEAPQAKIVTSEEIATLAYSYWAERGYQGGSPQEDWVRAEKALAVTSLS